jgi:hypothetical protein
MPLVSGGYPPKADLAALAGGVQARYNVPRWCAVSDSAALTTQVMTAVPVNLQAGDLVTSLAFASGATAANTPTNWWFALYSNAATPALLAQTADQTTGAWAADTVKDLALTTPQLISVSGIYWAAIMVKATTPPSLVGVTLGRVKAAAGLLSTDKALAVTSGSALTTTAPATLATPTTVTTVPLVCAH